MSRGGAAASGGSPGSWRIIERSGSVASLHGTRAGSLRRREVWIMRPAEGAVVLGSGQHPGAVDATAARRRGLAVLRRRSGGGAVLVSPADLLWVDMVVPRGDPLWHPDTGRSFGWLGELWRRALGRSGIAAEVHEGRYEPGRWGSLVCFAGRGPGEVFVAGRKVIGLSQRRTGAGARYQCGVLLRWDPAALADLLVPPAERRGTLERDLSGCAAGVDLPEHRILEALLGLLQPGGNEHEDIAPGSGARPATTSGGNEH